MLIHRLLSLGNNAPKGQEGRATRQVTEVGIYTKNAGNLHRLSAFLGWTTEIRTQSNRTKTCCATITP